MLKAAMTTNEKPDKCFRKNDEFRLRIQLRRVTLPFLV